MKTPSTSLISKNYAGFLDSGEQPWGATQLFINADGGGSNGWRVRLWKVELQKLANETGA